MRRKPRIRYSAGDKALLRSMQKKVNQRIYYERSKGGDTSYLPDTIKIRDLESSIATRADFNFQINQMNKLLEKDAMKKVETKSGREFTRGFIRQISNAKRRENIKRTYNRKRQEEQDLLEGRVLGSNESAANNPRVLDIMNDGGRYLDQKIENVMKMSMDSYEDVLMQRYKDNYILGLKRNHASQDEFGNYIIDDKLKALIKQIEDMDPYKFDMATKRDERYSIQFRYFVDITEDSPIDYLTDMWNRV